MIGEGGILIHSWCAYKMIKLLWRGMQQHSGKLHLHLPSDPVDPTIPRKHLQKFKKAVYCRILCNSKRMETSTEPLNRGLIE